MKIKLIYKLSILYTIILIKQLKFKSLCLLRKMFFKKKNKKKCFLYSGKNVFVSKFWTVKEDYFDSFGVGEETKGLFETVKGDNFCSY